jgi:hypothetical protein
MKIADYGSASISQMYGSADPDPYQNFMDPQHWVSPVFRIRIDLTLKAN